MAHAHTRVGLFGFGRIGRNVFRQLEDHPNLEVAAIVDVADPEALVYLLKYDTVFGRFPKKVGLDEGHLVIEDRRIPMLQVSSPADVDWEALGVDLVVQATRKHRTLDQLQDHLDRGARRVILASTPQDDKIPTLLMGVNDHTLDPRDAVIALGSNTSNALAPILKILNDRFGVEAAMYTVVHAFTNEQRLADVPGDDLRTSRSAAENIIPTATNSAEIIESVLPELSGKLSGAALNVPVADGSNVDLVVITERPVTVSDVNGAIRWAASNSTVIEYTDDPIVSTDVIGNTHSAIFDGLATLVIDETMVKSVIWFDNGWGYAARAIELMGKLAAYDAEEVTV